MMDILTSTWPEYSPHGYVWMIPKEGGRANVGLVTTDKKGAIKYLDKFVEDTYLKGKEFKIQNGESQNQAKTVWRHYSNFWPVKSQPEMA